MDIECKACGSGWMWETELGFWQFSSRPCWGFGREKPGPWTFESAWMPVQAS